MLLTRWGDHRPYSSSRYTGVGSTLLVTGAKGFTPRREIGPIIGISLRRGCRKIVLLSVGITFISAL